MSGGQPVTVAMHDAPVKELAWVPEMNLLVTGSWDKTLSWTRHSRNQSLSQWSQYTQHVCSINVDSQGLLQLLLNEHVSTQELAAVKWVRLP
ncbi:hypothetical protein MRB53_013625 [Persea americana]|uniref:Uncharacterized protein n=1 Tax=Persea americana TaxID=3435 RepID=A0ACC2K8H9_PERAE|nr:hypothetical protein MRB53_013625 [Persea americana]